ncbi:MAG: isochorismatase family protein [Acidobacteriia bacterium]|nr:isochorismatase family protein [Terriglobia bacterium]
MDLILDPKTTALVLIDLQYSNIARQLSPHTSSEVLRKSVLLANALRNKEGVVIFVRVLVSELLNLPVDTPFPKSSSAPPPNASDLVPEAGVQPGDLVVTKRQWGAFYGTDLEQHLRRRGIRTIVLGGIATNFGVESTARAAFDRGYELVFAEDAMSSITAEAHSFTLNNLFPRIGRVRSAEQIAKAWQ